jgi:RHS repeat-associated protein
MAVSSRERFRGPTLREVVALRNSDTGEVTTPDPVTGKTVVTNLRLPGQYDERLLASVGLQGPYYNWNRWYLPSVGRYLELDPIAKAGGFNGFRGPNWYGYAEGNPRSVPISPSSRFFPVPGQEPCPCCPSFP